MTTRELVDLIQLTKQYILQDELSQIDQQKAEKGPAIYLLLFQETPRHRQFLENVAKAITDHFAPAAVVYVKNAKEFPQGKLLIGENKAAKVHGLTSIHPSTPFFTLAPLDSYQNDMNLKRDLWHKLKSLPFQNMLR
ncbi:MAG: hypothetical protein KR126chlam2_00087 [Chlamydiae bacterium]|nr:hypothetical protein [Chlamydiota bacterium]